MVDGWPPHEVAGLLGGEGLFDQDRGEAGLEALDGDVNLLHLVEDEGDEQEESDES